MHSGRLCFDCLLRQQTDTMPFAFGTFFRTLLKTLDGSHTSKTKLCNFWRNILFFQTTFPLRFCHSKLKPVLIPCDFRLAVMKVPCKCAKNCIGHLLLPSNHLPVPENVNPCDFKSFLRILQLELHSVIVPSLNRLQENLGYLQTAFKLL